MAKVNYPGYVVSVQSGCERTWWLVREASRRMGVIWIHSIYFPKKFIGKRVKLKVELVDEK